MKNIGVYCGSFNPFHQGHLDILIQAERIFDEVIIARGINDSKKEDLEPIPSKWNRVIEYDGLLTSFLDKLYKEENDSVITLIRGLRNGRDLEDEINLKEWLNLDNYNVVYFISNKNVRHISSSAIRNLRKKYPELVEGYLVSD